jgi:hypothetical protein
MKNNLEKFTYKVADYIDHEYGGSDISDGLTDDERYTIRNLVTAHYEWNDSVSNVANHIINYLRKTRQWNQENIK